MEVHSYTIIHYGKDYVGFALRSIYDLVDQIHILYTPHPTHGHRTEQPPIETRDDILAAVSVYDPERKIHWYDVEHVWREGQHRDLAVQTCQEAGADMVLVVDCDEIWHPWTLDKALDMAWSMNSARNWLINFTHFWRSFEWVCRDQGWPVRIIDLRHESNDKIAYIPKEFGEIYHFGYAVRDEVLRYKIKIHGHKNEFRPDWYESKWLAWPPPVDCHPTNEGGFWNPVKFSKSDLPMLMREHPFYNLERID